MMPHIQRGAESPQHRDLYKCPTRLSQLIGKEVTNALNRHIR